MKRLGVSVRSEKWSAERLGGLVAEAGMKQIPPEVRWDEAFAKLPEKASGKAISILLELER